MAKKEVEEGKMIAVLAYLTLIGLVIAFVLNNDKKNKYAAFHIRQALMLFITGIVLGMVSWIPLLGWIVGVVGSLVLFVFWLMGLIAAIQGNEKKLPLIGDYAEEWFKSI